MVKTLTAALISIGLAAHAERIQILTDDMTNGWAVGSHDRIVTEDGSRYIDATGGVWRVYSAEAGWRLTLPQQPDPVFVGMINWDNAEGYVEYADMGFWGMSITTDGDLYDISYTSGDGNWRSTGVAPVSPIELQPYENGAVGTVTLWYSGPVVTQRVDGVAWQSDVDSKATFGQVMDILNYWDGAKINTNLGVARSLSVTGGLHVYDGLYLDGVLFVPGEESVALTNGTAHNLSVSGWATLNGVGVATTQDVADAVALLATSEQAAAVVRDATNALVQTYLLGSNAWMIVSNDVLRIWHLSPTNSLQTNLLWQSGDAFPAAATQTLWTAILQLTQDLDAKAGRAWGQYAPDGAANPDPAYMTFLNAPATVYASGAQWSTYGTYAVLTATGTVAFASGGDGQFRIGPNSTNWFGYIQGGSITVGAVADSLTVVAGGKIGGYAEIVYPYAGGDFPALWFTPSLALDFTEVGGAVWIDNLDGTATATAPAESAAGFWYATTTSVIDNYFTSTMPARLDGGIVGATNALPVVYDSVITISAGGKNYRIPAQEVE